MSLRLYFVPTCAYNALRRSCQSIRRIASLSNPMYDAKQIMAMKYAFVTNRALRAITCIRAGRPPQPEAYESLELAAQLLLEMRRGAASVAGSQEQLGYSAESIPAATRALSVIRRLSLASRVSEVHSLLQSFESNLNTLATPSPATSINSIELDNLERFMRALNQSLTEEVSVATLGTTLETPENVND